MARSMKDTIDDEVRRKFTDLLASANLEGLGISASRVATEILLMLPSEFVRTYAELFEMALAWSPQTPGGGGKDEGKLKASGKSKNGVTSRSAGSGEGGMHTREMSGAKTGGKRFSNVHFVIRSEKALREKTKLDRRITRAAQDAIRAAHMSKTEATDENALNGPNGPEGGKRECADCGRKFGNGWKRCPFHD